MLAASTLLYAVHDFVYDSIKLSLPGYLRVGFDCAHNALYVLLPVTGWVGESWLGRYRAIVVGLIICTITLLLFQVTFVMLNLDWTPIPAFVLAIGSLAFGICGIGGFYTNMLPFAFDQMIGAPAEDLSAAVQWYLWGFFVGMFASNLVRCIPLPLHFPSILPVTLLGLGSLSLLVVLIMDCLCHKWLDTRDKTGNPIKLIYGVLNYARKNKYPRLRSAFTYIDEEQPSRVDFGKHKFGGPFTEEEVEDVKTVFRLMPLLVAVVGPATMSFRVLDQFGLHAIQTTTETFDCVSEMKMTISYFALFVLIPAHRLIVRPLFNKYFPSMLKMIGAGFCICLVTTVVKLVVGSVGHFYSNSSHCIFDDTAATARYYSYTTILGTDS